jgi:hypothetical protein
MAFQGTHVARGRGRALVVATGGATEVGKIAAQVATQPREETPLQKELARVGRYLTSAATVLCLSVFVVGVLRGIEANEMLLTAASLAVAAIPEGLPAATTIVLALGVQRMAERHVIVRRLSSVETLGSVTVVFTDKTGTLTENRMQVQETWSANGQDDLLLVSVLCNNATLDDGDIPASGDPTEVALLTWARDQGVTIADWPVAEMGNDFLMDREVQRTMNFTGIPTIRLQDAAMITSMGSIIDRTREHVGTTDAMVIATRRKLIKAAKLLRDEGMMPPASRNPAAFRARSCSAVLPSGVSWIEAFADWHSGRTVVLPAEGQQIQIALT